MTGEVLPIARFRLGKIVTTPQADEKLTQNDILIAIRRHQAGEWGEVADSDRAENNRALEQERRLRSVYQSEKGVRFSLITEADRSVTTVSLADVERLHSPVVSRFGRSPITGANAGTPATVPSELIMPTAECRTPTLVSDGRIRSLQIEEHGDPWKGNVRPKIRIMGKWLERAGFRPRTRVSVICCQPGVIELRAFGAFPASVNLASRDQIQNPS